MSELVPNPGLLAAGVLLIVIAFWLWRRASRHDLKEALIESAWDVARGRRSADNPTAIERKLKEIGEEPGVGRQARKAASTVAGHIWAQVLSVSALAALIIGLALAAAGLFWR